MSRAQGAGAQGAGALTLHVQWAEGVAPTVPDAWFERVIESAVAAGASNGAAAPEHERHALESQPAAGDAAGDGGAGVALLLADDETLHELNRQFRRVDKPTDVLSFEGGAGGPPGGGPQHLGDIAISVERARRQAVEYGHSFERELAYLCVHGTLHLLGYDHERDQDQAAMRRVEEAALAAVGLRREVGAG